MLQRKDRPCCTVMQVCCTGLAMNTARTWIGAPLLVGSFQRPAVHGQPRTGRHLGQAHPRMPRAWVVCHPPTPTRQPSPRAAHLDRPLQVVIGLTVARAVQHQVRLQPPAIPQQQPVLIKARDLPTHRLHATIRHLHPPKARPRQEPSAPSECGRTEPHHRPLDALTLPHPNPGRGAQASMAVDGTQPGPQYSLAPPPALVRPLPTQARHSRLA